MNLPLEQALIEQFGRRTDTERLGGKSGAQVWRLRFERGSVIVKASSHATEYHFYTQTGPFLRAHGIGIPALLGQQQADDTFWLALEDIPQPLPRGAWQSDSRLIHMLARLHSLPADQITLPAGHFVPDWTDTLTEQASECFPPNLRPSLRQQFGRWQHEAARLFQPECFISGDPNPANWGMRANGSLALFDWERFCRASPAVDLAIIIPGLGTLEQFQEAAAAYLRERPYPANVDQLAEDIARAKLWTVVGYLSEVTEGRLERDSVVEFLTVHVPAWLDSLSP
jgi:aminoglycoside phosphotransferase (APT) family kinase protein